MSKRVWMSQRICLTIECPQYGMVRQLYGVVKDGMLHSNVAVCADCLREMALVEPMALAQALADYRAKQDHEREARRMSSQVGATFVVEEKDEPGLGVWTTPGSLARGEKTDPTLVIDDGSQNDTRRNYPIEQHWPADPECLFYTTDEKASAGIKCGPCAEYWRKNSPISPF